MKLNIHIALLFSALSITAILSCSMEKGELSVSGKDGAKENSIMVSANDFVPGNHWEDAVTKVVVSREGTSAPSFSWKESDVIGVVPMNGRTSQSNYEIAELGEDAKTALFDGGAWALKPGMEYAAYYPYQESVLCSSNDLLFPFEGQKQCGNDNIDHLADFDIMYAKAVAPTDGVANFKFSHLISIVRIQITIPEANSFSEVSLRSDVEWFARFADLPLSDGKVSPLNYNVIDEFTLPIEGGADIKEGGVLTVWLAVVPSDALVGHNLAVELPGTNFICPEIPINTAWEAGKAYSYSCAAVVPRPQLVDLGLPSGLKWADRNLGAVSPEDYGGYYAWGEIQAKKYFSFGNYRWSQGNSWSMTKYCTNPSYGTVDSKNVLDPEDDAAQVGLGGVWRMPRMYEFEELVDNCTSEWTALNGVYGMKFTSKKNSNSIFLPAAGFIDLYDLIGAGDSGDYWVNSLYVSASCYAEEFGFDCGGVGKSGSARSSGLPIRPVSE